MHRHVARAQLSHELLARFFAIAGVPWRAASLTPTNPDGPHHIPTGRREDRRRAEYFRPCICWGQAVPQVLLAIPAL